MVKILSTWLLNDPLIDSLSLSMTLLEINNNTSWIFLGLDVFLTAHCVDALHGVSLKFCKKSNKNIFVLT